MSNAESTSNLTENRDSSLFVPSLHGTEDRFLSLASFRAAHSEMLKLHRESGNDPEVLAKIEQLISKGQATGVLLDNEDDRWAAQSLLDYWNSLLYRAGHEAPDATLVDFDRSLSTDISDSKFTTVEKVVRSAKNTYAPIHRRSYIYPLLFILGGVSFVGGGLLSKFIESVRIHSKPIKILHDFDAYEDSQPASIVNLNSKLIDSSEKVQYSPNGKSVLTVGKDKTARLWNLQGNLLSVIGKEGEIFNAVFSPDLKLIATTGIDGNISLWDYQGRKKFLIGDREFINGIVFSPNGKLIATINSGRIIRLWNIQGSLISSRKDPEIVNVLKFSPDGKSILTANADGVVHIWDFGSQHPNAKIVPAKE